MKIIAFGASSSTNSINKKVATYAASLFKNAQVEILDLNDFQLPLFSIDIEKETGKQALAQAFLNKITTTDILVVSMAEHNGNYTAAFKNIFDWCTRIRKDVFQDKPMLLMATSTGPKGGASVLAIAKNAFPFYGGNIKATCSLPSFDINFDTKKEEISNDKIRNELQTIIADNF